MKYLFIGLTIFFSRCFLAEPLPTEHVCDITVDKSFIIPLSKKDLFTKKLTGVFGYSNDLKVNLRDTMFYLYCDLKPGVKYTFLAKIKSQGNESSSIQILKVVELMTEGVDKEEIEEYKRMSPVFLENVFEKGYIKLILENNTNKLFQVNKLVHDKYQIKNDN